MVSGEETKLPSSQPAEATNIVQVVWHDAIFFPDTRKLEDIKALKMRLFESVGYLVLQDSVTTVIAAERNDESEFRDVTLIPSGSIREIRRLLSVSVV